MKKICIVGSGTAGLVTALILKSRFSSLQIDIVKSDKIGIIGVGEGSTEHWKEFADFVGITIKQLITETDATLKNGIMFEDWTKQNYFHNIVDNFNDIKFAQYQSGYAYTIINNLKPKEYTNKDSWNNKVKHNDLPKQF